MRFFCSDEGGKILVGYNGPKEGCSPHDMGRVRKRVQREVLQLKGDERTTV